MVTASHNPPEYNGLKLLNSDGSAFNIIQQQELERQLSSKTLNSASWSEMGKVSFYPESIAKHVSRIIEDFPHRIKARVVVDCGCGAGSVVTPYLLKKLGCEVIALNSHPSGFFPRGIEPVEENLFHLAKATKEFGAHLGIAHDGDADRMMLIDEGGRFIPGDKLLGIFASELGAREVVTTLDASMGLEEMGFKLRRTKVGDSYVSAELKKGGDFGGEPSGSFIFPRVSLCPDGIYAAAMAAAIASRVKLSELAQSIPTYPMRRGSISTKGVKIEQLRRKLEALKPLSIDNTDGLRLAFEDGWLLVRASGTEPKIRLSVEARSVERLNELYESALKMVREEVG